MKHLLFGGLLFTAFSFGVTESKAQTGKFGVNAGVNFANITGKDAADAKIKTGFQAGLTYDIGIADDFVIQPGVSFVQNGAKYDGDFEAITGHPKVNLNYIQVPVTFQYQPELGMGRMILGVGPYVGFGVGDVKISNDDGSISDSWKDLNMKKVDAGGKLLVGYQLSNGLSLNLNANLGLTSLDDSGNKNKINNTSFGLTLGYKF